MSTYENPSFQYDDFSHGPPMSKYKYGDDEPGSITFQGGGQKKANCCYAFFIFLIVIIYVGVIIGLCVYFLVILPQEKAAIKPVDTYTTEFRGEAKIVDGPFSQYSSSLNDAQSSLYQLYAGSFEFMMDEAFKAGAYSDSYKNTEVSDFRSGSVIVIFTLHFKNSIPVTADTTKELSEVIIGECERNSEQRYVCGQIVLETVTITASLPTTTPQQTSPTTVKPSSECVYIPGGLPLGCDQLYHYCKFPNFFGHSSVGQAKEMLESFAAVVQLNCFEHSKLMGCALTLPKCVPEVVNVTDQPPTASSGMANATDTDRTSSQTTRSISETSYNTTIIATSNVTEEPASTNRTTTVYKRVPPCKVFCEVGMAYCGFLFSWGGRAEFKNFTCDIFPNSTDPDVCIGGKEATEETIRGNCTQGYVECDTGRCIKKNWRCDNYQDCEDNTDEVNEDCRPCPNQRYRCGRYCIEAGKVCDGKVDCSDKRDETQCVELVPQSSSLDRILHVLQPSTNLTEYVCADGWNQEATDMVCTQMGYSTTNATITEVDAATTSDVARLKSNTTAGNYIQGNLLYNSSCPTNKIVSVSCGEVVCGIRPAYYRKNFRIIGGDEVLPGTWPWLAALTGGAGETFFCGASLIAEQWVMTAAHCIGSITPRNKITVTLGVTRRTAYNQHLQQRTPIEMIKYPNYTGGVPDDIGLIKLNEPVNITDYVRPICLPPSNAEFGEGTSGYVAGWGKTEENGKDYSETMREVVQSLTNRDTCEKELGKMDDYFKGQITISHICSSSSEGYDGCAGDSGSPFVHESNGTWQAIGITETGYGCGRALPAVYTNVAHFVDWIKSVIED